jgi:predicted nucleic acid-binding protein
MYKNATKCNETIGKWCKNKHGASKIIDTFETYQSPTILPPPVTARVLWVMMKILPTRATARTTMSDLLGLVASLVSHFWCLDAKGGEEFY